MKEFSEFFLNHWVLIVILGNFLVAASGIISKIVISGSVSKPVNPAVYTFYSGLGGAIIFFTFLVLNIKLHFLNFSYGISVLGVVSGIFLILGLWPFYKSLSLSEASRVMTLFVGGLPFFTFLIKYFFLSERLGTIQLLAFAFLVLGGILVSLKRNNNSRIDFKSSFLTIVSALMIAIGLVLAGEIFASQGFLGGFFWISIGYLIASFSVFFWPGQKNKILSAKTYAGKKNVILFFSDKTLSISGSGIIKFAISLVSATLVNAFEGLKQFFVLILASAISFWRPDIIREELKGAVLWQKIVATVLVGFGLLLISINPNPSAEPSHRPVGWGVTFSNKFSRNLGIDPRENFIAILDGLKIDRVRLIAYWDEIEKEKSHFDFSSLDWQVNEAQKRNVKVVLAIGMKVPRWPECHLPGFVKSISSEEREKELKLYMAETINHYKSNGAITVWQVENEPFFPFGECPQRGKSFLSNEVSFVKSIDGSRPVLVTDSGELGLWLKAIKAGDIFGTTMYRRVYNKYLGKVDYHLPPEFFILKRGVVKFLIGNNNKRFIVIELAAEPWMAKQIYETAPEKQLETFDLDFFKDTVKYAESTGFDEYYLWGAEWWYYLKTKGHPEFWQEAKKLWQ